jgi:hypothetical protein
LADANVVELEGFPGVGEVALRTFASEVFGWWGLVATAALGVGSSECTLNMAAFAVEVAMSPTKWKEAVINVFAEEGNDLTINGRYLTFIRRQRSHLLWGISFAQLTYLTNEVSGGGIVA